MIDDLKDESVRAAGHIAGDHIDYLFGVLYEAKRMKDGYTEDQKAIIEETASPEFDRLALVHAMSRNSDESLANWEQKLMVLRRLADGADDDLYDCQEIRIITMFFMLLAQLKPRSMRHLENFLAALTDGEWMDGFILGKGNDTEFRAVDRADEQVRKHFGL